MCTSLRQDYTQTLGKAEGTSSIKLNSIDDRENKLRVRVWGGAGVVSVTQTVQRSPDY